MNHLAKILQENKKYIFAVFLIILVTISVGSYLFSIEDKGVEILNKIEDPIQIVTNNDKTEENSTKPTDTTIKQQLEPPKNNSTNETIINPSVGFSSPLELLQFFYNNVNTQKYNEAYNVTTQTLNLVDFTNLYNKPTSVEVLASSLQQIESTQYQYDIIVMTNGVFDTYKMTTEFLKQENRYFKFEDQFIDLASNSSYKCGQKTFRSNLYPNLKFDYDSCTTQVTITPVDVTNMKSQFLLRNIITISNKDSNSSLVLELTALSFFGLGGPADCYTEEITKISGEIYRAKRISRVDSTKNYQYMRGAIIKGTKEFDDILNDMVYKDNPSRNLFTYCTYPGGEAYGTQTIIDGRTEPVTSLFVIIISNADDTTTTDLSIYDRVVQSLVIR